MIRNIKIPKHLGAIKVPKKVRKRVRKAVEAAASPFVRDFATAAMAAAGRTRGGDNNEGDGKMRVVCGETRVDIEGSKVAEAFRAAAVDGFRRFLEGFEEGLRKAGTPDDPQPEPQAAPKAKPKKARPTVKAKAAPKPRASRSAKRPRSPGPAA